MDFYLGSSSRPFPHGQISWLSSYSSYFALTCHHLFFDRFCQLCEVLLEEDFITAEKFAIDFLPHLLTYQEDKIANVKLALSRTLTRAVMVTGECAVG